MCSKGSFPAKKFKHFETSVFVGKLWSILHLKTLRNSSINVNKTWLFVILLLTNQCTACRQLLTTRQKFTNLLLVILIIYQHLMNFIHFNVQCSVHFNRQNTHTHIFSNVEYQQLINRNNADLNPCCQSLFQLFFFILPVFQVRN